MRRTIALALFAICSVVHAQSNLTFLNPCPHIHSLIDLATGEANLSQTDYLTSGIQPIPISRAYRQCSGERGDFYHWDVLRDCIWVHTEKKRRNVEVVIHESDGHTLVCAKPDSWFAHKGTQGNWSASIALDNAHNLMGGHLSGQTNVANITLKHSFVPEGPIFYYRDGSGEQRTYVCFSPEKHRHKRKHGSMEEYCLKEVRKPNGNRLIYFYDDDHFLCRIEAQNASGTRVMGWVDYRKGVLTYHTDQWGTTVYNDSYGTAVTTSDRYSLSYTEQLHLGNHNEEIWNPYQIQMPGYTEWLKFGSWDADVPFRVNERSWGQGRTIGYHYILQHKVYQLTASLSSSSTLSPVATIRYEFGARTITLPNGDQSRYEFGKGGRPLTRYAENLQEHYLWRPASESKSRRMPELASHTRWEELWKIDPRLLDTSTNNNLYAHVLTDADRKVHVAQTFEYDEYGNVTTETLLGNLTGTSGGLLTLSEDNQLQGPVEESYTILRIYSTDGFNLLLEESDGISTVRYRYKPGTNLLESKFTLQGDAILLREFLEYDDCAAVVTHICDDGSAFEASDLTDVIVRTITRTTPRYECPAFGLPAMIQEYYWDQGTQQEVLLRTSHFTYTKQGQLASSQIEGALTTFSYDKAGQLIEQQSANGFLTHYEYDQNGNCLAEWTDGIEGKTTYSYDYADRMTSKTEDGALTWHYEYDEAGNLVCEIDPQGHRTETTYDALGRMTSQTTRPIRGKDGAWRRPTSSYAYDPLGNVTCETKPDGYITRHTYNARGQRLSSEYPDGTTETFCYHLRGNLIRHTTQEGAVTTYTYDALGNPLTEVITSPEGVELSHTSHTYKGRLKTSTTDALGILTTFCYDGAGRLLETHRGNRHETIQYDSCDRKVREVQHHVSGYQATCWTYDDLDQVVATWTEDETGRVLNHTSYQYDNMGRIVLQEVADGDHVIKIHRRYNRMGQLLYEAKGQETQSIDYEYDVDLDQQKVQYKTTTDAHGGKTQELFDPAGNLDTLVHRAPDGTPIFETHYFYDGNGHRIQESRDEVITQWIYGPMGRLEQLIEAGGGRITRYEYDEYGQLCAIIKPEGTRIESEHDCLKRLIYHAGPDFSDRYQYDALGQLLSVNASHYEYDIDGEVIIETLANGLTLTYSYDALGRPTSLTLPDASEVGYEWDSLFLRCIHRKGFQHHYRTYNGRGQLVCGELGNGTPYALDFDEHDRCQLIQSILFFCLADYDAIGDLTHLQLEDPKGAFSQSFKHDGLHHLTSEEGLEAHHYAYDAVGNRISCDGTTFTFDDLNQEIAPDITWDQNGCLKRRDDQIYSYDSLDRLIRVEAPTFVVAMTYDYQHRRQTRTLYTRSSPDAPYICTERLRFLYQGDNEIGAVDEDGKIVELRVLGIGQTGDVGSSVLIELNGIPYFPLHDHRGSVSVLLDADGVALEHYRYLAFGAHQTLGALGNPWRFASKRLDAATGLVYFGRRYYDPQSARWITPDPIGYDDGPNRYAYCHNRPLTRTDYRGYFDIKLNINFSSGGLQPHFDRDSFFLRPRNYALLTSSFSTVQPIPGQLPESISLDPLMSWYETPGYGPGIYDLRFLGRVDPPNHIFSYINGMKCGLRDALGQALTLSNHLGGWNVYLVYNETHGFMNDLKECRQNVSGNWTNPTHRLHRFWNQMMDERSDLRIMHTAFSQGTLHTRLGIKGMSRDRAKNIYVAALGYVIPISKEDCGMSINLASTRDYVSMSYEHFASYYEIRMMRDRGRTAAALGLPMTLERGTLIKPHPDAPFADHCFDSPTYARLQKKRVRRFFKQHAPTP